MPTEYHPISCDCVIMVESKQIITLCKLHESKRDLKDNDLMNIVKAHNLAWTGFENDDGSDGRKEREAIRKGDFSLSPKRRPRIESIGKRIKNFFS